MMSSNLTILFRYHTYKKSFLKSCACRKIFKLYYRLQCLHFCSTVRRIECGLGSMKRQWRRWSESFFMYILYIYTRTVSWTLIICIAGYSYRFCFYYFTVYFEKMQKSQWIWSKFVFTVVKTTFSSKMLALLYCQNCIFT